MPKAKAAVARAIELQLQLGRLVAVSLCGFLMSHQAATVMRVCVRTHAIRSHVLICKQQQAIFASAHGFRVCSSAAVVWTHSSRLFRSNCRSNSGLDAMSSSLLQYLKCTSHMKDRTCSIAAGQGGGAERKWLQKPKFATERRKRGEEKRGRGEQEEPH